MWKCLATMWTGNFLKTRAPCLCTMFVLQNTKGIVSTQSALSVHKAACLLCMPFADDGPDSVAFMFVEAIQRLPAPPYVW